MAGVRLGRLLGIPFEVRYSFLILVVLAYYYGVAQGAPGLVTGLLGLLCASVLIHEAAHALVARWLGVPPVRIDLNLLGGAVKLAGMPSRARDEALIAIAGPLASLALAGVGEIFYQATHHRIAAYFVTINLSLGVFNLLPVLPLDGGRILRAALTPLLGIERATQRAVLVARIGCVVGGLVGLLVFKQLAALLFATLFWVSASSELATVKRLAAPDAEALGLDGLSGETSMRVLDERGRPARGASYIGGTYVIEEHRSGDEVRWVVRGEDGAILLVTDTPLT
ncbi:MAG: M50 family metallopeptidase [Myxococcales bacterium]|nr:M50 family metallopeptidase [Myxococcales bacterium]